MNHTVDLVKEKSMNIYQENGYANRNEYLLALAEEYEINFEDVKTIANTLGKSEDFDGLVNALDDWTALNSNDFMFEEEL